MIQVAQVFLSLSILIFFHELGHFTFAKIFKTRVEKFYLFFNPWFSLFKFKKGETEYGIGWLPLGGYVKIAGMIDESMDKDQLKKTPQPWEFRSKPAGQRLLIMLGGVLVNFLLAFIIYIGILYVWGEKYLPVTELNKNGVMVDSLGLDLGLRSGDKIISVNDKKVKRFSDVYKEFIIADPHRLVVERNGQDTTIELTNKSISKIINHGIFFGPRIPFVVAEVQDSSLADNIGLKNGDKIVGIDTQKIEYYDEFKQAFEGRKNDSVNLFVLRGSDTLQFNIVVPDSAILGVKIGDFSNYYEFDTIHYTFIQAIPAGINKTFAEVGSYLQQLKLIFTPETKAYKSVGSFFTIGKLFSKEWNWELFWTITALLSVMLGVLNLLPIPGLDGGHVMFVLYEMIARKKPSDKFLERAQLVGMIILLFIIVYALGNDILRNVLHLSF